MRPIDADALEKYLNDRIADLRKEYGNYDAYTNGVDDALTAIEDAPTLIIEDLGIVRCKDCKYFIPAKDLTDEYYNLLGADGFCDNIDKYTDSNDFCSDGDCGAKMGGGE